MSPKTATKTRSPKGTLQDASRERLATDEALRESQWRFENTSPMDSCWDFRITGRGTSGWMSWVKDGGRWVPLRASDTSFVSAVAAIEPEIMRLAFPHKAGARKGI